MAADVHSESETTDVTSGGAAPGEQVSPEVGNETASAAQDDASVPAAVVEAADGDGAEAGVEGADSAGADSAGVDREDTAGEDAADEDTGSAAQAPAGRRRIVTLLVVAVLALAIDIVSKMLVVSHLADRDPIRLPGGFLRLTLIRNSGAAFSIGEGQTWVFTIIATAVVVVILRLARNLRSVAWACALGLLLGGALGNLSDRIFRSPGVFRGNVVDWLQFPRFPVVDYDFPVFNLADSAIVVGGCLMVLLSFLGRQPDGTRHTK